MLSLIVSTAYLAVPFRCFTLRILRPTQQSGGTTSRCLRMTRYDMDESALRAISVGRGLYRDGMATNKIENGRENGGSKNQCVCS
ncbi:hypothetical protein F5Y18DRAFT_305658 [Xylariaceae sp. FL1019]|nr:hypothetical protein F5Y18DRAFT_305658 [Xylariaceae sp. FL1019]